jgi:hypothetical protein
MARFPLSIITQNVTNIVWHNTIWSLRCNSFKQCMHGACVLITNASGMRSSQTHSQQVANTEIISLCQRRGRQSGGTGRNVRPLNPSPPASSSSSRQQQQQPCKNNVSTLRHRQQLSLAPAPRSGNKRFQGRRPTDEGEETPRPIIA